MDSNLSSSRSNTSKLTKHLILDSYEIKHMGNESRCVRSSQKQLDILIYRI